MRYKTLFRIICKAIGVYFIIVGGSGPPAAFASLGHYFGYFLSGGSSCG